MLVKIHLLSTSTNVNILRVSIKSSETTFKILDNACSCFFANKIAKSRGLHNIF